MLYQIVYALEPENPNQMWEFVESVRGVAEACNQIKLKHNKKHPTPIIAMLAFIMNQIWSYTSLL